MSVKITFSSVFELVTLIEMLATDPSDMNINISGLLNRDGSTPDPDSVGGGAYDTTTGHLVTDYYDLEEGDRVRWEGRTIQATGTVVEDSERLDNGDIVVRIRRDDNGKTFKITFNDEPTVGKMYRL